MSLSYEVKLITTKETLALRKRVLKPFLTEEECRNPGDDDATTFHQGLYLQGRLVSISTFLNESHPAFSAGFPYRLRGMATDSSYQGQGLGLILLRHGVEHIRKMRGDLIWFNAREKAFSFYQKMGFQSYGPMFDIQGIGPHKVMYKHIIPR
jgi:GNAT superfamily N-acetyltransferase